MKYFIVTNEVGNPIYFDHPEGRLLSLPLGTTQDVIDEKFNEKFKSMKVGDVQFIFEQSDTGLIFLVVSDRGESDAFLRRQLRLIHDLLLMVFGPHLIIELENQKNSSMLQHQKRIQILIDTMCYMSETKQSFLVQAVERLEINEDLRSKAIEALDSSLSKYNDATYGMLFIDSKLVAHTKKKKAFPITTSDLFQLVIFYTAKFDPIERAVDRKGDDYDSFFTSPSTKTPINSPEVERYQPSSSFPSSSISPSPSLVEVGQTRLASSGSGRSTSGSRRSKSSSSSSSSTTKDKNNAKKDKGSSFRSKSSSSSSATTNKKRSKSSSGADDGSTFSTPNKPATTGGGGLSARFGRGKSGSRRSKSTGKRAKSTSPTGTSRISRTLALIQGKAKKGKIKSSQSIISGAAAEEEEAAISTITRTRGADMSRRSSSRKATMKATRSNTLTLAGGRRDRDKKGGQSSKKGKKTSFVDTPAIPSEGTSSSSSSSLDEFGVALNSPISSGSARSVPSPSKADDVALDTAAKLHHPFSDNKGDRNVIKNASSASLASSVDPSSIVGASKSSSSTSTSSTSVSTKKKKKSREPESASLLETVWLRTPFHTPYFVYAEEIAPNTKLLIITKKGGIKSGSLRTKSASLRGSSSPISEADQKLAEEAEVRKRVKEISINVRASLIDYIDYLITKSATHVTMLSYLQYYPGLVHFIFVDRTHNQVIAPKLIPLHGTPGFVSSFDKEGQISIAYLERKVRQLCFEAHDALSENYNTMLIKQGQLAFSYRLWFEDDYGRELPFEKEQNLSLLPIDASYYPELTKSLFPFTRGVRTYELYTLYLGVVSIPSIIEMNQKLTKSLVKGK